MKPEARISRDIQTLLRTAGFAVWSTEQGYRQERGGTRTTAGFPDLVALGHGLCLFIEVKGPKGVLTFAQKEFKDHALENGLHWYCWRSDGEAWDALVALGVIVEAP